VAITEVGLLPRLLRGGEAAKGVEGVAFSLPRAAKDMSALLPLSVERPATLPLELWLCPRVSGAECRSSVSSLSPRGQIRSRRRTNR
jgi:hypothetical protein